MSGAVSPPRSDGAAPPVSGPHPRLAMPAPLAVGGRLTLPGLLGQIPPPGWPHLPPALAGLNPALFKSGMFYQRVAFKTFLVLGFFGSNINDISTPL